MEIPDNILKKLKGLLKMADGAKKVGSISEAEAFALKAQQLMAEYNLQIHDISMEDPIKMDDVTMDYKDIFPKNEGTWIKDLYHLIAYHNYSRAINFVQDLCDIYPEEFDRLNKATNKVVKDDDAWYKVRRELKDKFYTKNWEYKQILTIRLIGEAQNVEMTKYIVEQLINRVRPMAKDAWKDYNSQFTGQQAYWGESQGREKKGQFIRGFLSGFVTGVSIKLSVSKEAMERKNPEITTMALTITNQVEKYCANKFHSADRKTRSGGGKSEHGLNKGIEKGLETNIREGLNTNDRNQKLLS